MNGRSFGQHHRLNWAKGQWTRNQSPWRAGYAPGNQATWMRTGAQTSINQMLDAQYAAGPQAPALMWIPYPMNRFEGMEQFNHITQQRTSIQTVRCANCNHATALIIDQDNNPQVRPKQKEVEKGKPASKEQRCGTLAKPSKGKDSPVESTAKAARASSTQPREEVWVEEDYEPTDPSYTPAAARRQRGSPEEDNESIIEVELRSPIKKMSFGPRRVQPTPSLKEAEEFELVHKEPNARRNRSPSSENQVNGVSDSEDEDNVDFDEIDALRKLLPHLVNCPYNEAHQDCHMWSALRSISSHQLAMYLAHNIREEGAPSDEVKIVADHLRRRKAGQLGTSYLPYQDNKKAFKYHQIHVRPKHSSTTK